LVRDRLRSLGERESQGQSKERPERRQQVREQERHEKRRQRRVEVRVEGQQERVEVRDQAHPGWQQREARVLKSSPALVGVDTGGTFTDLVAVVRGRIEVLKVRSTPRDPAAAVLAGLAALGGAARLHYGSTVATNALLERRGARVLLLTTAGFEDVLEIGRQVRPLLYALEPRRPAPLVARGRRVGVHERILADGTAAVRLDARAIARARAAARRSGADAVAICLLHSYARPEHERRLGRALAGEGLHLTLSHR